LDTYETRRGLGMSVTDQEKAAKARDAALQGALTQIERQFGKGTVMRMGDEGAQVRVNAVPTGALSLDLALGIGGVPRGRVVEVDSVAALTPRAELEGQMGDQSVGLQARMMSQAMRKLAGNLNRTQTLCIFTNQIREKVGVMFGSPETQPGGRALKFYSSQRLDIRRIETLKDGTEAVGNRVRVKVVKNKVAAPFRQAEFDIEFGKGISSSGCILDLGIEHNVVTKSGSFFSYNDERLGQGRNNAKAFLDEHQEISREIEDRVYEALGLSRDPAAPVMAAEDDGVVPEIAAA